LALRTRQIGDCNTFTYNSSQIINLHKTDVLTNVKIKYKDINSKISEQEWTTNNSTTFRFYDNITFFINIPKS
jgi:hypothetical protein